MSQAPPPPPQSAPPPSTPPPSSDSSKTIMLVLSYLGLLALIPLFVEKDDQDVQWHAKNGLCFFGAYFVIFIALAILDAFMPWGLSLILGVIRLVLFLGYLIIIVLGIVKAVGGQKLIIPGVSDFVSKF